MKYPRLLFFILPMLLFIACSGDDDGVTDPNNNNNNNTADTEKPTVLITNPVADQEISGDQMLVEVTATDNRRVVKVDCNAGRQYAVSRDTGRLRQGL
jgi:hypothetical protein